MLPDDCTSAERVCNGLIKWFNNGLIKRRLFFLALFDFKLDRCPSDTTLEHYYDEFRSYQRFKVLAFRFFDNYDSYYIHCELLVCHVNSLNSRLVNVS